MPIDTPTSRYANPNPWAVKHSSIAPDSQPPAYNTTLYAPSYFATVENKAKVDISRDDFNQINKQVNALDRKIEKIERFSTRYPAAITGKDTQTLRQTMLNLRNHVATGNGKSNEMRALAQTVNNQTTAIALKALQGVQKNEHGTPAFAQNLQLLSDVENMQQKKY